MNPTTTALEILENTGKKTDMELSALSATAF